VRNNLVIEAVKRTALRSGNWAMIPPYNGPEKNTNVNIELGNSKEYKLYNLENDISQRNNLAKSNPEKLQEMINLYSEIIGNESIEIKELILE
jgi:arylsulfatase A-like enzyme